MKYESPHEAKLSTGRLYASARAMAFGTFLEWFDFTIYGLASALVFNVLFFPDSQPGVGLILSFATFAVGFLARPVGAIILGRMGDRIGRQRILVFTIVLMGASTALIGVLPDAGTIGIFAPALLVLLRILQGFGAGAEQAGAALIMSEMAPPKRRGFFAALPFTGSQLGIVAASGVFALVALLPSEAILAWGWRIPFVASVGVVVVGFILRRRLPETPAFVQASSEGKLSKSPLIDVLKGGKLALLRGIALKIGENGTSYLYFTFAVGYLAALGESKLVSTIGILLAAAFGIFTVVIAGALSDRFGRRPIYIAGAIFQILFAAPAFMLLSSGNTILIWISLIVAIAVGVNLMFGAQGAFLAELFPTRYRYTGVGTSREIGAVLSGGFAPLIASVLLYVTGTAWWPVAVYVGLLACVSLLGAIFSPETAGRDLNVEEPRNAH